MARVTTTVDDIELEGDHGAVPGLSVTCDRCGHEVEVYGTSGASARRAGVMLAEECPQGERNFYAVECDDEYDDE